MSTLSRPPAPLQIDLDELSADAADWADPVPPEADDLLPTHDVAEPPVSLSARLKDLISYHAADESENFRMVVSIVLNEALTRVNRHKVTTWQDYMEAQWTEADAIGISQGRAYTIGVASHHLATA